MKSHKKSHSWTAWSLPTSRASHKRCGSTADSHPDSRFSEWLAGRHRFAPCLEDSQGIEGIAYKEYPEKLTCAICLDLLCEPTSCEPCRHCFCSYCLKSLTLYLGNSLNVHCPLCRELIQSCSFSASTQDLIRESYATDYAERQAMHSKLTRRCLDERSDDFVLPSLAGWSWLYTVVTFVCHVLPGDPEVRRERLVYLWSRLLYVTTLSSVLLPPLLILFFFTLFVPALLIAAQIVEFCEVNAQHFSKGLSRIWSNT